jgi:hypothetical protein
LKDENFNSGDIYASCFCLPDHKPSAPSNKLKNPKELILGDTKGTSSPRKRSGIVL